MKQSKKIKMVVRKIIAKNVTETKVMIFKDTTQCEKYGFNRSGISKCLNGYNKHYKGYTWDYIWIIRKINK